jgi:hypothetical protein
MCRKTERLWDELSEWSQKTFGSDEERGPIGSLRHLKLEAEEAIQSGERDEYADCLILILDAARRGGFTCSDLIDEALKKLEVCKTRTYLRPLADEISYRVRG